MTGIYKISCPNGWVYIGQSRNIEQRWKQHVSPSKRHGTIGLLIMAYGSSNHRFDIIHAIGRMLLDQ